MSTRFAAMILIGWLAFSSPVRAVDPKAADGPAGADRFGDPLPSGALARMGTVRLRHGGPVAALVVSLDGRFLASAGGNLIHVWDGATGKEIQRLRNDWVNALAFSPNGQMLASATGIGTIHLWNVATGKEIRHFGPGGQKIHSLAFAPDGLLLASGNSDKTVRLWQVASGKEVQRLTGGTSGIFAVAFSPDGAAVAAGSQGVRLWETTSGKLLGQFGGERLVFAVGFSPDGRRVAAAGEDAVIRLWERTTGAELRQISTSASGPRGVAFASGIAAAGMGQMIYQWDLLTGKDLWKNEPMPGDAAILALSPDGKILASVGANHMIRIWKMGEAIKQLPTECHQGGIRALACSSDGKTLFSTSQDGTVRTWETASGKLKRVIGETLGSARVLACTPDGKTFISAAKDGSFILWDGATGKESGRLQAGSAGPIREAALSADGSLVAAVDSGQAVFLWRLQSSAAPMRLPGPMRGAVALAFSPDKRTVAGAGSDGQILLWDVATGKELARWKTNRVGAPLVFSPDSALLATDGKDGMIAMFDVGTGKEVRQFQGHPGGVHALAFSPDGRMLASGGDEPCARVWELASGQEVRHLEGHNGPVTAVAFSADGQALVSGSTDTSLLVWDLTRRLAQGDRQTARSRPESLETLWKRLADRDGSRAYDAVWDLAAAGNESGPFLTKHLELFVGADQQRVARLIKELDADQYEVRKRATADLESLGKWAEPALRKALANSLSLEAQRRIDGILAKLQGGLAWPQERLRVLRSIGVLEAIGSPAAQDCLRKLAQRAPEDELRQQAKAALSRLERKK